MEESNYQTGSRQNQMKTKLNTRGCCFLCLHIVDFKSEFENEASNAYNIGAKKQTVSLKLLQCHLEIKPLPLKCLQNHTIAANKETNEKNNTKLSNNHQTEDLEVDLCEQCSKITNNVSRLFLSLEKVQMEIDYWLGGIHQQISEAFKQSELVQEYSKRMTRDPESLAQLLFVDNLRKEITKKTSPKRSCLKRRSTVLLKTLSIFPTTARSRSTSVKTEQDSKILILPPLSVETKTELEDADDDDNNEEQFQDGGVNLNLTMNVETADVAEEDINLKVPAQSLPKNSSPPPQPQSAAFNFPLIENDTSSFPPPPLNKMYFKTNSGKFQCAKCKKTFTRSFNTTKHFKSVHLSESHSHNPQQKSTFNSKTGRYNCGACNKDFLSQGSTWLHYQKVHLRKKYKCDICNISVLSCHATLAKHKETCRDTLQSRLALIRARKGFQFSCTTCGKRFNEHRRLREHYKLAHLNVRKHSCDLCSKSFKQTTHLKRHKLAAHLGRRWECEKCKKLFNFKDNYLQHKRKCESEKIKTELQIETQEKGPTRPEEVKD